MSVLFLFWQFEILQTLPSDISFFFLFSDKFHNLRALDFVEKKTKTTVTKLVFWVNIRNAVFVIFFIDSSDTRRTHVDCQTTMCSTITTIIVRVFHRYLCEFLTVRYWFGVKYLQYCIKLCSDKIVLFLYLLENRLKTHTRTSMGSLRAVRTIAKLEKKITV